MWWGECGGLGNNKSKKFWLPGKPVSIKRSATFPTLSGGGNADPRNANKR